MLISKKESITDKRNSMDGPQTHDRAKGDPTPCAYSIYTKFRHRQNRAWIIEVRTVVVSGDRVSGEMGWKRHFYYASLCMSDLLSCTCTGFPLNFLLSVL